jgi:hypothetical protein
MLARTDVGGAYKYNYETGRWDQLLADLTDADRGYLSIDAMCIDPTDDDTFYMLCGCAYFSSAGTQIFKTTDGGKTFDRIDVTDLIQVHGNGYGRQSGEAIAIDPENTDVIYCGGDVTAGDSALIKSVDGGKTWSAVKGYDDLGYFSQTIKWPFWTDHVVKSITDEEYKFQNGVATIAIEDGKVYVGTSIKGETNVVVADMADDKFEALSTDLPTDSYPSRINKDADGNLLISYIGNLTFGSTGGGIYKYDTKADSVTNISPTTNSYGGCVSLPDDSNTLVATTCGVWSGQMWEPWTDSHSPAYGDVFYKSSDGGANWTRMTPGQTLSWGSTEMEAEYLQTGGYDWIYDKAIHWVGAIVIDPRNTDKILLTSGNGVFACDNVWDKTPSFYFDPTGIEEVVALDMISVKGGNPFSAIGDYDGFEHFDLTAPGKQHNPNMGSTAAIAYCPQNPDVMVRYRANESMAYYTTDGGNTWTKMANAGGSDGKGAITQLEDGSYRIFHADTYGKINYSDDFGDSWSACTGTKGTKAGGVLVDLENPQYVYAYTAQYNDYWASDSTKKEPTLEDACYNLMVSTDYGATFTNSVICKYDQCDVANRIAYLGEGQIVLGAGYNGAYISTDYGKTTTKLENVNYCKTIGYGAPEKEGDVNTLYMYGKPQASDAEGIYRSQDAGETWVLINTDKLYGGTGNGNFLVGDMNDFGTVYMSTVGCGIVYGTLSGEVPPTTTEEPTTEVPTTEEPATTEGSTDNTDVTTPSTSFDPAGLLYGDTNLSNSVTSADVVTLNKYLVNKSAYALKEDDGRKAYEQADCKYDKVLTQEDSVAIINFCLEKITLDDLGPQED